MANTIIGAAKVFNSDGTVAITGSATFKTTNNDVQSAKIADNFQTVKAHDGKGFTNTIGATDREHVMTLVIQFRDGTSGTPTQATAANIVDFPAPLAKVTTAGFGSSLYDGDWNYIGNASINRTRDGFCELTMDVWRGGSMTPAAFNAVS